MKTLNPYSSATIEISNRDNESKSDFKGTVSSTFQVIFNDKISFTTRFTQYEIFSIH